jgi:hypothetical protein
MKFFIVAAFLSIAAHTFTNGYVWEPPRPDNCHGEGFRLYSSTIKLLAAGSVSDSDWMYNCARTSATINGQYFARPTRCLTAHEGLPNVGEFDVIDSTCNVDYHWLFEKIGLAIGKDMQCWRSTTSGGCNHPFSDSKTIVMKNYLNAACVAHDLCYSIPSNLGISKDICDKLLSDLGNFRCKEVDNAECSAFMSFWYKVPIWDYQLNLENEPTSKLSFILGQHYGESKSACSLTVKQRQSALYQGSRMDLGSVRWSPNGLYFLVLQHDGNLVLYRKSGRAVWASKTGGLGVDRAELQSDGNFVLYTVDHVARWHTGTDFQPTNHLLLQDDGIFVLYSMGHPTVQWSSNRHNGYLIPMSTNLRTESLDSTFNSTSDEDIGTMMMQEPLSDPPVDIVHFDRDPNISGNGAGANGAPA